MNVAVAFAAGLMSVLSPCVLPLIPAFLANMTGTAAQADGRVRWNSFRHALAFVLGASTVFSALWMVVIGFVEIAGDLIFWAQRASGLLLILFGIHMVGLITLPVLQIMLRPDPRPDARPSLGRSFAIGLCFGFGWSPCVGPYLASVLGVLLATTDAWAGGLALFAYAVGLGVPFLVAAVALDQARGVLRALQRAARPIEVVGGALVASIGLLLVSGRYGQFIAFFSQLPAP